MTVEEYVNKYQHCFLPFPNPEDFKNVPPIVLWIATHSAEYGIRSIRDEMGTEIEAAVTALGEHRTGEQMDQLILEKNQKWNDINILLMERTGKKWLKENAIQILWEKAARMVEEGFTE